MRSGQQMGVWAKDIPVETFVICYRWPSLLGESAMKAGADVRVSSWRRAAPDTFPALAKAGGDYLNSQLSAMEARLDEYAEGIMLDSNGWVAEEADRIFSSCATTCCTRRRSRPASFTASPAIPSCGSPRISDIR